MDKLSEKDLRNLALFNMALEKQMPKKPEFLHMLGTWTYKAKCPDCGAALTAYIKGGENPKYCSTCGQAFDWAEESEDE